MYITMHALEVHFCNIILHIFLLFTCIKYLKTKIFLGSQDHKCLNFSGYKKKMSLKVRISIPILPTKVAVTQ